MSSVDADSRTEPASVSNTRGMDGDWLPVASSMAVGLVAYALNPRYLADTPYYAMLVSQQATPRVDSGHLVWVPLGRLLYGGALSLGLNIDALSMLRVVSAIFTSLLLLGTWRLSLQLGLTRRQAWLTFWTLAATAMTLLTGGSGGAMPAMAAMGVAAVLFITRRSQWTWGDGAAASMCIALGWSFWGIAAFLAPLLAVAAHWYARGAPKERLLRAAALSVLAGVFSVAIAAGVWGLMVWPQTHETFFHWLWTASRGDAEQPSLMQFIRASYGSLRALLDLGDLGFFVKTLLLRSGQPSISARTAVWACTAVLVCAGLFLALVGLLRSSFARERSSDAAMRVATLAAAAWLPIFAFAATIYGGSELHMIAGAAPFLAMATVVGLDAFGAHWAPLYALLLATGNIAGTLIPVALNGGGPPARVGAAARQRMPPGSLVVLLGQEFTPVENQLALYRDSVVILEVRNEMRHRPAALTEMIQTEVARTAARGGKVAVLSDVLGIPTAGGLRLSKQEVPDQYLRDAQSYFERWHPVSKWSVGRYRFVELAPPDSQR